MIVSDPHSSGFPHTERDRFVFQKWSVSLCMRRKYSHVIVSDIMINERYVCIVFLLNIINDGHNHDE